MSKISCEYCGVDLNKDCTALNKKLLGRNIEKFMCITCLADYIGCNEEDLFVKIEEFKEQGCTLFN
jgi:hypothetical protein